MKDIEDTDDDEEFKMIYNVKKSKTVNVELPRNPWADPEVTSMLDRNKITDRQAVGIFSALVKSGNSEGKEVDLDDFTLSQSSVH